MSMPTSKDDSRISGKLIENRIVLAFCPDPDEMVDNNTGHSWSWLLIRQMLHSPNKPTIPCQGHRYLGLAALRQVSPRLSRLEASVAATFQSKT